jgi:hypothetical protein
MTKKAKKREGRIRCNIYLDADQKAVLEKLTEETRVPWAEYVREGVDLVLAKHGKKPRR